MSEKEFAEKVYYEGSLMDAFIYGLTPDDCEPGMLKTLLIPAHAAYLQLDGILGPAADYMDGILEENEE